MAAHAGGVTNDENEVDQRRGPARRSFTAEYKQQILDEYDTWPRLARTAILRRRPVLLAHLGVAQAGRAGAREGLAAKSRKRRSGRGRAREAPRRTLVLRLGWPRRTALEIAGEDARSWSSSPARTPSRDRSTVIEANLADLEAVTSPSRRASRWRNRSTIQRRRQPLQCWGRRRRRPAPANKLTEAERQHILTVVRARGVRDPRPGGDGRAAGR